MNHYSVTYRGEFTIEVMAKSPEEAVNIALADTSLCWDRVGELHSEFAEAVEIEIEE